MSDYLNKIIKSILLEYDRNKIQRPNDYDETGGLGAARRASQLPATGSFQADRKASNILQPNPYEKKICDILYNARNKSWAEGFAKSMFNNYGDTIPIAAALMHLMKKNPSINPKMLKGATMLLFRESKGSAVNIINPREVLGFIHNIFGGNHSQGYAQIQPKTAKEYGIDMKSLYTVEGSLEAAIKMLESNYRKAKQFYSGSEITKYKNGKLVKEKAVDGDAALHLALAAHNAGSGIINKWCETNCENIANPCSVVERDALDTGVMCRTKKNKVIPNYFPNKGKVHGYMPQSINCYNLLSALPANLKMAINFNPNFIQSLQSKPLLQPKTPSKTSWDRNSAGDEGYWSVLKKRLKETGFKIIQDPKDKYFQYGPWKIYKNPSDGYQIYGAQVPYRPVSGKIVSYKGKYAGEVLDKTIIQTKNGKKYTLKNLLTKKIPEVL